MVGKVIRMERILDRNSGKTVIVPMDHGITLGPIPGLENMKDSIATMVSGGANAIVLHKGIVKAGHRGGGKDVGLIVHLSASTSMSPNPDAKVPVCTVEEAIKLGADAVSVHINLGAPDDKNMLKHLGEVSDTCARWGMPLLAMMYTRGEKIENEFDAQLIKHAARAGAELGADIVKVNYSGSPESFKEVVSGCPVPVVIAGGEKVETDEELLKMVEGAMEAGACGVSIGRNTFQHEHPEQILRAIGKVVHENISVEDAKGSIL